MFLKNLEPYLNIYFIRPVTESLIAAGVSQLSELEALRKEVYARDLNWERNKLRRERWNDEYEYFKKNLTENNLIEASDSLVRLWYGYAKAKGIADYWDFDRVMKNFARSVIPDMDSSLWELEWFDAIDFPQVHDPFGVDKLFGEDDDLLPTF